MKRYHLKAAAIVAAGVLLAAAVDVASAAPKRPGVTPDLVAGAIAILEFNHDPTEWTKGGKPKVAAIERVLNADISADDRDLAWQSHKAGPANFDAEQLARATARLAELETTAQGLRDALQDTRDSATAWQVRAERAEGAIATVRRGAQAAQDRYERLMAGAEADRNAADRLRREARAVLEDAERRERGAGPPASRDCRKALREVVIDADIGWLSGAVKVDEKGRSALAGACLFSD